MSLQLEFVLNGKRKSTAAEPELTLLEVLREDQLLTGTKEGCGVGECGACVVLVDGIPITSCLVLAADAHGKSVETVEGLAEGGSLSAVQQAFMDAGGFQCGFCTPGMVITATALLRNDKNPDVDEVKAALGGILCRCGAYPKILDAVAAASASLMSEGDRS